MRISDKINDAGLTIIRDAERLSLTAYLCPAGIPTIGWGHTRTVTRADVGKKRISEEEAHRLLAEDIAEAVIGVELALVRKPTANQFSAMVSLAFNIGNTAFAKSSIVRHHNAGNVQAAAKAFGLWIKARNPKTGKLEPLPGLVARRAKEAALYLTADTEEERTGSAQAVAPEPPLMSKIEGVAGAAAAVAPIGQFLAGMDWRIAAIIAVVALAGIGAMVWTRFNERGA